MALATCAVVRLALSEPAQDDQRVDRPRGDLDCFYTFRKSLLLPKPRDVTYRQRKCLSVLACDAFGADLDRSESGAARPLKDSIVGRKLLHCRNSIRPMSGLGLGCVKTPALAADVETF